VKEQVLEFANRLWLIVICLIALYSLAAGSSAYCGTQTSEPQEKRYASLQSSNAPQEPLSSFSTALSPTIPPSDQKWSDYLVKVAYGRTFGTSTNLDYATLEVSKSVSRSRLLESLGPTVAELHFAMMASYVMYYEGTVEKVKKLDFSDGYEVAWVPKGRFIFPGVFLGMIPYGECGMGISYVSETYRNSGSRFNWSLLGGLGLERRITNRSQLALGIQWRHLSNGNMWGVGDELHNSNSGTDMVQAIATFVQPF
jgi:hypothetical protein